MLALLAGAVAFVVAAFGVHHVKKNYNIKNPVEKKSVDQKYKEEKDKEEAENKSN